MRERAPVAPWPAHGLTELTENEGADLVVVGSSAHAEPGRVRLERTAGRLLQGAPCAVAVAPGGLREDGAFRHIAVAYDGSPEARAALAIAYGIAAQSQGKVSVMLIHGQAVDAIRERCEGVVDLLVTGSRGYGPIPVRAAGQRLGGFDRGRVPSGPRRAARR